MKKISSSKKSIKKYNLTGMHANIISEACYSHRKNMGNALSGDFLPYIISALIVFNMERQMGKRKRNFDKSEKDCFAARLLGVLENHEKEFLKLDGLSIDTIDIDEHRDNIEKIYEDLAVESSPAEGKKRFPVGATKVLHFIHPELFPIVDSKCASVLRDCFEIEYNKSTSNYSKERYIASMKAVQGFVEDKGAKKIRSLEQGTPITRIFDKLAFVQAKEAEEARKK